MAPDRTDPFTSEGEWLRCALHAHTTRSDGELEPEGLAAHYGRAGYDVLAITDHWKRTEAPSTDDLVVLPSVELNCILPGARDGHVLGYGIAADADLAALGAEYADLERTAAFIQAHGGVAYLAHPYWTGVTPAGFQLPENVAGIEVWNAGCELEVGRGLSSVHWDELLETGRSCYGLVTDDSHHPGFDSDHGWTWLRVAERTPAAVLAALASGSFYGSSGPLLHAVEVAGDEVEVSCSPARSITLVSGRSTGAAVNAGRLGYRYAGKVLATADDGLITQARLTKPFGATFARLEVTDAVGRRAWTNPL
ncbi:MAG TPA: CehA/McbA family metallohydrolase [Gaiellaceae bacterium]|nr:CehA/McbA family metallohydrolase [Gaiellaceae bacterium]